MKKILICICTYHRPDGLRSALLAIDGQSLEHLNEQQISLGIIDNSPEQSAKQIAKDYEQQGRFAVHYVHAAKKGLCQARNAALQLADQQSATHLAFVDDDGHPQSQWLETLSANFSIDRIAAVVGPTYPIFETPPPAWLPPRSYAFTRPVSNGFVSDGSTGNCMISMAAVRKADLTFDLRFNITGGEDTHFFNQLKKDGDRIAWAQEAIIHELFPADRMTRSWLWRRWYRTGSTEAILGRRAPTSLQGRLVNLGKGSARILAGAARISLALPLLVTQQPDRFTASFFTFCRGLGYFSSALGLSPYQEYSRPEGATAKNKP